MYFYFKKQKIVHLIGHPLSRTTNFKDLKHGFNFI